MSKIEWTEKTWNPIIGCSKVSEGCKNCYAEKMSSRLATMSNKVGEDYKRVVRNKHFNGELVYLEERISQIEKWQPSIIFVNSMSDFLRGKNSRGWKVDFDFVFCSPNKYLRIIEGTYRTYGKNNQQYRKGDIDIDKYRKELATESNPEEETKT